MTKSHKTQWTAQFLVAAELARRGYEVSFTMGNATPIADLMVGSPRSGRMFWVDVKGLSSKNAWFLKRQATRPDLFYILVLVDGAAGDDRFFILDQGEANQLVEDYIASHPGMNVVVDSFNWSDALPYENCWFTLPDWDLLHPHFQLFPGRWYAYEMQPGYGNGPFHSPVYVKSVSPTLKRGALSLVELINPGYAAGVQDQVIELSTKQIAPDSCWGVWKPGRKVWFRNITADWLIANCAWAKREAELTRDQSDLQQFLSQRLVAQA